MGFPWIHAVGTQPVLLGLTLRILHLVVSVGFKETAAPGMCRLAPHLRPFPALAEVGVGRPRLSPGCVLVEALPGTLSRSASFSVAKKRTPGGWGCGPQQPHSIIITKTPCQPPETEDSCSGPD